MTTDLRGFIRSVPDFPKPGVTFRDISPLLADVDAFNYAIDKIVEPWQGEEIDAIGMLDARGFIFGTAVAIDLGLPFFMIRKAGKLPGTVAHDNYELEYGSNRIEMSHDAITVSGTKVLLVDDVLATGGTAAAAARLIHKVGGDVVGLATLMELTYCEGRKTFKHAVTSCLVY